MINGDRVKQARELRGFTQKDFAARIKVNQSSVSQIEAGLISPSDEVVQRIVLQTGFPLPYFKQSTSTDFPLGSLLFRAKASMTLRQRCEARQHARVMFEILEKMESNIRSDITLRIPRLEDDPVSCAIHVRSLLGLSTDAPIDNLTHVLESNGVVLLALPIELEKRDAFSSWVGNEKRRPVIVLPRNTRHGDRLRFNIAHELGHLVMHQTIAGDIRTIEEEASVFASEFLMPKEAMERELIAPITLKGLFRLKSRWKVSIQTLIRRANELRKITDRQYKYLMQRLSLRGWRTNEPIEIPIEKPRLVGQMAEILYGSPIDYRKLASNVNLPIPLIIETLQAQAVRDGLNDNGNNVRDTIVEFSQN
jgi:Zn-dependent peptidase ImmA (M78 family)/transcriptional regulator with XRE-family HTH domain